MKPRITLADLETKLLELNQLKGTPTEPFIGSVWQIGNYHLFRAYGSQEVHRVITEGGATETIVGYATKRTLYEALERLINKART